MSRPVLAIEHCKDGATNEIDATVAAHRRLRDIEVVPVLTDLEARVRSGGSRRLATAEELS